MRHDIELRRPIKPEEREIVGRICFGVAVTAFFLTPLVWPLLLLPDGE